MAFTDDLSKVSIRFEEQHLTPDLGQYLKEHWQRAQENAKCIRAFSFLYRVGSYEIAGFIVLPLTANDSGQKLPSIIYNRGGTGDFGVVKRGQLFTNIGDIAKNGYVVLGSQYPGNHLSGGHDERGGELDLQSVAVLYDIMRGISLIDMTRIGMYGFSRGGMMTYMLLAKTNWIKAAVVVGGVTNAIRSTQNRPELQRVMERAFGGSLTSKKQRSAVYWPELLPVDTPILVLHGECDERVSSDDARELVAKMRKRDAKIKLMLFKDDDHAIHLHYRERDAAILKWFKKYLQP